MIQKPKFRNKKNICLFLTFYSIELNTKRNMLSSIIEILVFERPNSNTSREI